MAGSDTAGSAPSAAWAADQRRHYSPAVILLIVLLVAMIAPPIYHLIQTSLHTTNPDGSFGELTLQYYEDVFTGPRFIKNLINTTIFALASAAFAILLGVGQAWIVERTNTPLRQYVFLVAIMSLGIPNVLYTVSWLLLLGKAGPVNTFLKYITGSADPIIDVYTMTGMILIEGFGWTPLAFLMISSVFRTADASFEEASLMSGGNIGQTFRNITYKLALPAVLALTMLIVIRAFEGFEIPAMVGMPGKVFVLATDIFDSVHRTSPPNFGQGGAFAIGLLAIVVVMLHLYGRLSQHAERYQTITGKGYRPRPIDLGPLRYVASAVLVLFFVLIIVLPVAILIWGSLLPFYQQISANAVKLITIKNYLTVLNSESLRGSVINTMILGVATATLTTLFTAICAWFVVRRYKGGWILDQLAMAPLIFPAIVLGIALLRVFLSFPFPFYGTLASVILASLIRYLPYGMRYSYAGILQIHGELEEASSISGARKAATFVRIVIPLIAPSLITCWLFVFLLAVKAVSLPILLVGPRSQVMAVTLFDMWQNGQIVTLAAMGVTWMVFMTLIATVYYVIAKRHGLSVR
jgi:iron(III) transport system permease protein